MFTSEKTKKKTKGIYFGEEQQALSRTVLLNQVLESESQNRGDASTKLLKQWQTDKEELCSPWPQIQPKGWGSSSKVNTTSYLLRWIHCIQKCVLSDVTLEYPLAFVLNRWKCSLISPMCTNSLQGQVTGPEKRPSSSVLKGFYKWQFTSLPLEATSELNYFQWHCSLNACQPQKHVFIQIILLVLTKAVYLKTSPAICLHHYQPTWQQRPGSDSSLGPFLCGVFMFPVSAWIPFRNLIFLPQSNDMHVRLIGLWGVLL